MKLILAVMLCAGMARGEDVQAIRWGVSEMNSICPSPIHDVSVSVSMVTNVSTNWLVVGTSPLPCPEGRQGCLVYHFENVYSKTEYNLVTVEAERKTLSFMWDGVQEAIMRDREVSRKTKKFRKTEGWNEVTP